MNQKSLYRAAIALTEWPLTESDVSLLAFLQFLLPSNSCLPLLFTQQEAVAVGMESGMKPSDKLITAYRCHPFTVQKGGTIKSVIAELFGEFFSS